MEKSEVKKGLKKVLIVDDNKDLRGITRKILEKAGYEVLEAPDGATAVALMAEKPDLILQDLILPDIAGYDLVYKLRAHSENPLLPVLAFSGFLDKLDAPWDTSGGFNGFLGKPFEAEELLEALRTNLAL